MKLENKIKIESYWLNESQLPNHTIDKSTCVWIDNFNNCNTDKFEKKIFVWVEPNEFINLRETIINKSNCFDYILTYDEIILNTLQNAVLFEYGTTWIDYKNYNYFNKDFSVSFICGSKNVMEGHKLRLQLWNRQNEIITPKLFFTSSNFEYSNFNNPVLGNSKEPLFKSMFHICIENVKKNNFFTEKLIDSFICKTIPIYYGCPNISNYFDIRGMIIVNNLEEIIQVINKLNENDYLDRKEYIDKNYNIALNYVDYRKNLTDKIINLI